MTPLSTDDIVARLQDLPSLPAVVMELLTSIDPEDVDISVLAKKVSHDQALTAKTLRLANSSFYGLQCKVRTIEQAIAVLGFDSVRALVTSAGIIGNFSGGDGGFDFGAFWRHAVGTAVCAKRLARIAKCNQEFAFVSGLLHDIGRLVLVTTYPQRYSEALAWRSEHDCEMIEAERAVLGVDHVAAGVALAEHWNFSDTMRLAIAWHHEPQQAGAGFLATIIHVANAIAHALDLARDEDDLVPQVSAVAWTALGLSEEAYLHVFRETELQFEEIATVLMA